MTKKDACLLRVILNCEIGRDALEHDEIPAGITKEDWLWNLLFSGLSDLAEYFRKVEEGKRQ